MPIKKSLKEEVGGRKKKRKTSEGLDYSFDSIIIYLGSLGLLSCL